MAGCVLGPGISVAEKYPPQWGWGVCSRHEISFMLQHRLKKKKKLEKIILH